MNTVTPWILGLTGGIGSGKSAAGRFFSECGVGVIDTDDIAKTLTGPKGSAMTAIASVFGTAFVTPEGGLDRQRMREHVFSNPHARQQLEGLLHPLILAESLKACAHAPLPYVVLAVPLLFENPSYVRVCRRTCVVDTDPETQQARVMARSGLEAAQVQAIMAAQLSREARRLKADDHLLNDADLDTLRTRVYALDAFYRRLNPPSTCIVPTHF